MNDALIADAIRDLAYRRGRGKTFCPSEVARALAVDWRPLMPDVRRVAYALDEIVATQKSALVDPLTAKGPIRLGLAAP